MPVFCAGNYGYKNFFTGQMLREFRTRRNLFSKESFETQRLRIEVGYLTWILVAQFL